MGAVRNPFVWCVSKDGVRSPDPRGVRMNAVRNPGLPKVSVPWHYWLLNNDRQKSKRIWPLLFKMTFHFICINICLHACAPHIHSAHGGQMKAFVPLQLELQMVVSCLGGAEKQIWPSARAASALNFWASLLPWAFMFPPLFGCECFWVLSEMATCLITKHLIVGVASSFMGIKPSIDFLT